MSSTSAAESAAKAADAYYQKKYPYSSKYEHTEAELQVIKKKFQLWYGLILFLQLILMFVLTASGALLLFRIYIPLFSFFAGSKAIFLHYNWPVFCFPAFFVACATVFYPLEWIQKVLMGSKHEIYNDYYSSVKGYDNEKAGKHFIRVCWMIFPFVLLPFITSGIIVAEKTFSIKHFYSLYPKRYDIAKVERILYYSHYTDGSDRSRYSPHYIIRFQEKGKKLKTINWEFSDESVEQFAGLLIKKGVKVDSLEVDVQGAALF